MELNERFDQQIRRIVGDLVVQVASLSAQVEHLLEAAKVQAGEATRVPEA